MLDELVRATESAAGGGAVMAWARVEAAACARRLRGMVAMLDARHAADGSADREQWYLDNWGAVCAEIGAAQQITSGAASNQLLVATALRDRLPGVAAAFADGLVSYRLVSAMVWRTALIKDPDALREVDAALTCALKDWAPMSDAKTVEAIDSWVVRFDPHALRRSQSQARSRCVEINTEDASGTASLWGTLFAADAKALDRRLDALAGTVCDADPRTLDQRRADAMGALVFGRDRLACGCDSRNCVAAAASVPVVAGGGVVIHVVAHEDTVNADDEAAAADDRALDGKGPRQVFNKPFVQLTLAEALHGPTPPGLAATRPGVMIGGSVLPGPITRRLAMQAVLKRIIHPGDAAPEPHYAASAKLADFVRCRDLTCRFPGCDEPATACDLDHTIPYPVGPTQASNMKCLCRKHHLLKTFWSGKGGWCDEQHPDGTVVWTSPGGQIHKTRPGSHLSFPTLCAPTAAVVATARARGTTNVGLTMPRRRRTRAQDRTRRVDDERRLNQSELLLMPVRDTDRPRF